MGKIILPLLVFLYVESGMCFSERHMRRFLLDNTDSVSAINESAHSEISNKFYAARLNWISSAENIIQGRLKEIGDCTNIYFWKAPSKISYKPVIDSIKYSWSSAYRQREQCGFNAQEAINSLNLVEEFERRLKDNTDGMYDIRKYRNLLKLSGFAGKMYWLAEDLYFYALYEKAERVLEFFLLPENKDGFVRGASHFYLGRTIYHGSSPEDKNTFSNRCHEALGHFIKVPAYPTCLTYISYSYIQGAQVAINLEDYKLALALTAVDVPSIDHDYVWSYRHLTAANVCRATWDLTNAVRHIQEAYSRNPKLDVDFELGLVQYGLYDIQKLWNWCATNRFTQYDIHNTIVEALTNENIIVDYDDLYTALTVNWPTVDQLPENIMTNRILNNNIFKPKINEEYSRFRDIANPNQNKRKRRSL